MTDFDATADRLDFRSAGVDEADVTIVAAGADTLVSLVAGGDTVTLLNLAPDQIGSGDILFA